MNEFEKVFEAGSVPGYMERLMKEVRARLMAKGISMDIVATDGIQYVVKMEDYRRRTALVHIQCTNNSLIEWRRYA